MCLFWLFDYASGNDPAGLTLSSVQFVLALSDTQAVHLLWQKYASEGEVDAVEFHEEAIESIVEVDQSKSGVL